MLVMEALNWANEAFKDGAGRTDPAPASPMLDTEVLLAAALDVGRSWLFAHLDDPVPPEAEERFRSFVSRRANREPVAYIVGHREFYGRRFAVSRAVLIPRPATELLVDRALAVLRAPGRAPASQTVIADIGTGSGAIAITLAAEAHIPVVATDASAEALTVARENASALGLAEETDFKLGNLADPLIRILRSVSATHPGTFRHLVLCANLPYLTDAQTDATAPDVRDFEPRAALAAGPDGLDAYWALFRQLARHRSILPERVTAVIEIDPSQRDRIPDLIAHDFPLAAPETFDDLEGLARVVVADI